MNTRRLLFFFIATLFASPGYASEAGIAAAKTLFGRYTALERAFDPAIANLYADTALIRNKRTYPAGQVRELTFPVSQYRSLIKTAMPLAAARSDFSTYSDVSYAMEGERVRITAKRFSNLKKYYSPFSLLVGPSAQGSWLIHEELSESQP